MSDLEPIEAHLRAGELLDPDAQLVIRGWPLAVDGMLRNADATQRRYSSGGKPVVAISAEVTIAGWSVDSILAGPRLRTRRSYGVALVGRVLDAGFVLLPTFNAPHYSVVLPSYTDGEAERLVAVFGAVRANPYYVRRER